MAVSRSHAAVYIVMVLASVSHPSWAVAQTQSLWSGRFDGAPDASIFEWGKSFRFDRRLFEEDVTGSMAWAEALERAGTLSAEDAKAIAQGLASILREGRENPAFVAGDDEDIHSFVERVLIERIGEPGRRLHTGRSRNDQVAVDMRMYVKRHAALVQASIRKLAAAAARQARKSGDAMMPSYTHLRRAQPILAAHYWMAHASALRRDHDRFAQVIAEADAMPLGSGAIAGTPYAVDTAFLAERLGFSRVVTNSMDAVADRDYVSAFLHATALTMVHLSRLAEDVAIFTGEEFAFYDLHDSVATGSSLMPQKKNPDPLELMRGKSGRAIGHLAGFLTVMKGTPTGYNKDLQEDKEALFDAEDTVLGSLAAAATVVETLALRRERTDRAAAGLLLATDVADYLVAKGVPFRTAHEVVGGLVRQLVVSGRVFEDLTDAEWQRAHQAFGSDVRQAIDPRRAIAAKRTPQSTNPAAVGSAIEELEAWLAR